MSTQAGSCPDLSSSLCSSACCRTPSTRSSPNTASRGRWTWWRRVTWVLPWRSCTAGDDDSLDQHVIMWHRSWVRSWSWINMMFTKVWCGNIKPPILFLAVRFVKWTIFTFSVSVEKKNRWNRCIYVEEMKRFLIQSNVLRSLLNVREMLDKGF